MGIAAATGMRVFLAVARPPARGAGPGVERGLIPASRARPEAVVVTDNLAAHKAEPVRQAFEAAGVTYRHLPTSSPDLMAPIEPRWSKLKGRLRTEAARSRGALDATL